MAWEHAFSQQMFDLALSEEDVEELRSERSIKHTLIVSVLFIYLFIYLFIWFSPHTYRYTNA